MAYSDKEVAEALIVLAVNKYNFKKTSDELGIPVQTLRRWNKNVPKKGVDDLLERAIERMLMVIPAEWKGHDWAVALGILLDKWLLFQGKATARSENIFGWLKDLPDEELDELIKQFEEAANSSSVSESGEGEAKS